VRLDAHVGEHPAQENPAGAAFPELQDEVIGL
jgi:hypothetical protein